MLLIKNPLSVAIDELYKGEVKIVAAESDEEATAPATEEAPETVEETPADDNE